ncbi:MAG: phosphodiester glycosidase family protein [Acidimicrobiales bacterium]
MTQIAVRSRPDEKGPAHRRPPRRRLWRAVVGHKLRSVLAVVAVLMIPVIWSAGSAMMNPALGSTVAGRLAEWAREHGGASAVVWAENLWYSHHAPRVGGTPAPGAIPHLNGAAPATTSKGPAHLPVPPAIAPVASPALAGEGQWKPAGRLVGGIPALYETFVRPDSIHTSVVTGVAFMDTKLLDATLYSGSTIPGGGPYVHHAPIPPTAANSLVAAFNSGFLMSNALGGYYTDGRTEVPLRTGAASFVVYRDGSATVGAWGRDVNMTSQVVAVRQNLSLLVDGGKPVSDITNGSSAQWGWTLSNKTYVWRSGVGVTADGGLVYVGGPDLDTMDLAQVLARAGAVRAMELDINTDWVNFSSYSPTTPGGEASATNGTTLVPGMSGGPSRYFESYWQRDFFTFSARYDSNGAVLVPLASSSTSGSSRTS